MHQHGKSHTLETPTGNARLSKIRDKDTT